MQVWELGLEGFLALDTLSSVKHWKEEFFFVKGEWQFHSIDMGRSMFIPADYHNFVSFYVVHIYEAITRVQTINLVFLSFRRLLQL